MNRIGTQKKILDAAELLFAENGYHGTSLRAITAKAGVNVAAVNYHFGSKKALLDNVFERRLIPLNRIRMEKLESVRAAARELGVRPSVRDLMYAFVAPTITFRDSGKGARNFIALIGRSVGESSSTVRSSFFQFMEPFVRFMVESLVEALPGLSGEVLLRKFQFSVGALFHTLRLSDESYMPEQAKVFASAVKSLGKGKVIKSAGKGVSGNKVSSEQLVEELVNFITAGMEA